MADQCVVWLPNHGRCDGLKIDGRRCCTQSGPTMQRLRPGFRACRQSRAQRIHCRGNGGAVSSQDEAGGEEDPRVAGRPPGSVGHPGDPLQIKLLIRMESHRSLVDSAAPMNDFLYRGTELDAMEAATNYHRAIAEWFRPYVGRRVVEIGAGVGSFSASLLARVPDCELTLVEPAANLFPLLHERFGHESRVKLVNGFLEVLSGGLVADSVVMVNVLEHIEKDEATLSTIHRILARNGTILLFVPAFQWLYGAFDVALGHYRRYSKAGLTMRLKQAGFEPLCIRYFNWPGVFAWFLASRVLRQTTARPADVRRYDKWVTPLTTRLERRWEPPFGQSLLAIARKVE
ncbi:MAG: class I SAM-dependent methyltransferase [Nitrospirae bacterium]|nr:MAG: class I SAM-dependent methyltransferase [Nitrospirota bacterium]